jgi:hypothetical protein
MVAPLQAAQEERLVELIAPLMAATKDDPEAFLRLACSSPPLRKWQKDVTDQVKAKLAKGERRIRVLVRSCHGAGKTFLAAGLTEWFSMTRPEARGVTTAPTWSGVENLLWPEIRRLHRDSVFGEAGFGRCLTTQLVMAPEWFTIGLSTDRPPNLEGHHSRTAALRVVDEAKAVPGPIFDATEGLLDAPEIFDLWISTPSVAYGHFYDRDITHAREGDGIIRKVVTIDDLIAEGIPGKAEWKADRLLWWGEESDEYQSRALARYLTDSERNLFPPTWVEKAMALPRVDPDTKVFGSLDVAGSVDGDENAAMRGRGFDSNGFLQVDEIDAWKEPNTMKTRERFLRFVNEDTGERRPMAIDTVGIGKGLYDSLTEKRHEVVSFVAQAKANDPTRFFNRKAELAFFTRGLLEDEKLILPAKRNPVAARLLTQMAGMRFKITTKGQKQLVDPDDSPDLVDALLIFVHAALVGLGRGIIAGVGAVRPQVRAERGGIRHTKPDAA